MRRLLSFAGLALAIELIGRVLRGVPLRVVGRVATRVSAAADDANIRRLAAHEGCSIEDARRLYAIARIEGYGAAHRAVFGRAPDAASAEPHSGSEVAPEPDGDGEPVLTAAGSASRLRRPAR
jgi:hypothetical protein